MDGGEVDVIARTAADVLFALAVAGIAGLGAGAGFVVMSTIVDRRRRRNGKSPPAE